MNVVVAVVEPYLRGAVAPRFETAPYYLIADTQLGRTAMFANPVQFQLDCSPEGLLRHLRRFAPRVIVAGSFSAPAQAAASAQRIELRHAQGRASDAVTQWARGLLAGSSA